jgi:negative regulator of flagellin synthesis FlgM
LKIDPPATSPQPLSRSAKAKSASAAAATGAEPATDGASAQVHVMPNVAAGGDFDAARVAAIREDIRAGRYQVHPERIASGLLASVRDLLGPENTK